jgi:kumamolisin
LGGGYRTSDLNTFFATIGSATNSVAMVSALGVTNAPRTGDGAGGEVTLDIEGVGAVAPKAMGFMRQDLCVRRD